MGPEKQRAKHSAENNENKQGSFEIALPIRIGIALVLVILSALFKMPILLRTFLLILASVFAGYDIFLLSVDAIAEKRFFSQEIVVLFVSVLSFLIGYVMEATIMIILYQISKLLIQYTCKRAVLSARNLIQESDEDVLGKVEEYISSDAVAEMSLHKTIESSAVFVLRFVIGFAILYVILAPLISGISFRVSLHRAMMILLVSSPVYVAVSFPVVTKTGLCFSARNGVLFNNARVMEECTGLNVALFDKAGVFSDETPHIIGLQSDILDKKTFINFLAHAVYYSDQPFAKAVSDYYTEEYRLDLIGNFQDIPGAGVSLEIGHAPVILATKSYFDSLGIEIPERQVSDGVPYYMTVADRYVGRVVVSSDINQEADGLVSEMVQAGVSRNILLTEDGSEQSQATADALHFTEVFGECDTDKKLRLISDISATGQNKTAFVYANGIEGHSAADIDIRVSKKGKYADILVLPEAYLNIPKALQISHRTKEIVSENAIGIFVIKAILIFLSIIGYSNLWFVVFMDTVAALATLLNAIRVTTPSLLRRTERTEE